MDQIICSKCGLEKPRHRLKSRICHFCTIRLHREYRHSKQEHFAAYGAKWRAKRKQDPEFVARWRARGRAYWASLRQQAFEAYGGYRCNCCGETQPKFLTMDHVNNNGSEHRKEIGNRGSGLFKWLKDHGYPSGFQVLCMNCNHGKALNGGVCPHKDTPSYENRVNSGEAQAG